MVEYLTKYATKNPDGSMRVGEIMREAMEEVSQHGECNGHSDFLAKSVQKFYSKTLGGRSYGIFEAVHLGLGLPMVVSMLPSEMLSVWGGGV